MDPAKFSEPTEYCAGEYYEKRASLKRCKINHASIGELRSGMMDNFRQSGSENPFSRSCEELGFCSLSSHKVSCIATVRGVNGNELITSGILYCTKASLNTDGCRLTGYKVLMEIKPEIFFNYQVCQASSSSSFSFSFFFSN